MKGCIALFSIVGVVVCLVTPAKAQDLGPHVKAIRDGIYVYTGKDQDSNVTMIRTPEGMVLSTVVKHQRIPEPLWRSSRN